jgi:hypothetical protein
MSKITLGVTGTGLTGRGVALDRFSRTPRRPCERTRFIRPIGSFPGSQDRAAPLHRKIEGTEKPAPAADRHMLSILEGTDPL